MLKPEPRRIARFAVTLPEGEQFSATGRHVVALSLDGTRLAYVANGRLNLRAMDRLDVTPIRGTEDGEFGRSPFFSPDGQWIGFWQSGELRKVSVIGGAPVDQEHELDSNSDGHLAGWNAARVLRTPADGDP